MSTVITNVETFTVNYPVSGRFKFFENPAGRPVGRATVVVKITADDGTVGWGQSVPSPRWSYETLESVQSTIEHYLKPELLGQDPLDSDALHARMNRAIAPSFSTGQPICKAGIDLALFDLAGKLLGQSAAERWGRSDMRHVTLSWTLNPADLNEVEAAVQAAFDRGYRHFNIKVAPDAAYDLKLCRLVRQLAPNAILWVDANGGYDQRSALVMAPKFAELGMIALEQPLAANRLSGFSRLKKQAALPIIMDEPIVSLVELREFHRLGLLDGVAIKVARCGGLTEAWRQVRYLEEQGLMFLGSGLTDPDLSLAASLCLFAAYGIPFPAALNGPQFLSTSILKQPLTPAGDQLAAPTGPGLGVEVDE
jgi:L-alanine-DL-glutamate epimerase-like enolase superfamily enzyme